MKNSLIIIKKMSVIVLLMIASSECIIAQNRAKFHYKIRSKDVLNVPRSNNVKTLTAKQQKQNEKVLLKKYILIYKNVKSGATEDIKICSKSLDCIITLDKGIPVVDFWQILPEDDFFLKNASCISSNTRLGEWRFEIDLSRDSIGMPTKVINVPIRAWSFGVGTVPFRCRLPVDNTPLAITTGLTFVANYGRMLGIAKISPRGITNYICTFGGFGGLSSADLKKATYKDPSQYKSDQTNIAASYGANIILARNNIGIFFSVGFDTSMGSNSDQWIYQNQPWFGFGINASLGYF